MQKSRERIDGRSPDAYLEMKVATTAWWVSRPSMPSIAPA
jgi:hypothetical protein